MKSTHKHAIRPGLAESIRSGRAVPILSDEVIFDLAIAGHQRLTQEYAVYSEYQLDDRDNLPRIARFHKLHRQKEAILAGSDFSSNDLRADYLDFVKNFLYEHARMRGVNSDTLTEAEDQEENTTVTGFAQLLGYPAFDRHQEDPLLVLANLPFRVLLTTSPYTFLESALLKAGKTPCTSVIRWRKDLRDLIQWHDDPLCGEDPLRPLVCHLFGLDHYSSSLVLTEDDYLDFVVDVNLGRGDDKRDSVPAQVRQALSRDLLVLGFSLNSWAFRAIYAGLIKSDDVPRETRGICVQLPPSEAERNYLHDYLQREARFEVVWKDLAHYAEDLRALCKT